MTKRIVTMATSNEGGEVRSRVVRVSAPGKVILHGEHSVVYGKQAVALSLNLRTHLTLTTGGDAVTLDLPDVGVSESWTMKTMHDLWSRLGCKQESDATPLSADQASHLRQFLGIEEEVTSPQKLTLFTCLHQYLSILPCPVALTISVKSQLPTGAGLGSSAAYAVCLSAALLHISGSLNPCQLSSPAAGDGGTDVTNFSNLKNVCNWAYRCEQIVHGTPSGIDNSICTYGGAVSFKCGNSSPLQVPPLQVLLVNTGVPRSTKALVTGVRERRERLMPIVDPILESLDVLADRGLQVLRQLASATDDNERDSAYNILHELVDINQALLCALGVSHARLDRLMSIAKSHSLNAKLTGAGGGGFGIVVLGRATPEDKVTACRKELEDANYQVWTTSLGAPGLTFHQPH
ncbi:mevalonate kinase-like isoform X2 [Homarus americanus]|uniref:mevalonate kinase-like isoform X2 n=1 Tax=Homarus americanus TaxID=6706 RepID=UPI001C44114B|nr:mevalonate kinase-like isoform X2 [Homarus americanus]